MGAVTNIVKRNLPASYRAMVGTDNSYYSLDELQELADYVQFRLFSTAPGATNEATVWNPLELELLGTLTSMRFIPAAVDYWGDQLISETLTGTNETVTYGDRREELWKLYDKLAAEADILATEVGVNVAKARAITPQVSYGDNGRGILVTPDPADFEPAFRRPSQRWRSDWTLV